jgi:H+/gluconate symporter-like permease
MAAALLTTLYATALTLTPTPVPPELTQEDHIRINAQALLISVIFVGLIILAAYLLSKRAGKRRYAAHQAKLAAEGRSDRSSALAEVANGGALPQFMADDADAEPHEVYRIAQVFGENYRPYGADGNSTPDR